MNYDIKIAGQDTEHTILEFDRINLLTKSTKEIATKALMLKLKGFSDYPVDKGLKEALSMYLETISVNKKGGVKLTIDCAHFSETIKGLQYQLFHPTEEVLELTPMRLVIEAFQAALSEDLREADIDKPLLKSLVQFRKNFVNDNQVVYLANRGTVAEVKLTKQDFTKISLLEESIPEPQKVIINGQLDEMRVSKGKLGIITDEGFVLVKAGEPSLIQEIARFIGKDVTLKGFAHFKSNGQLSFIEIQEFGEPGANDKFFSKKPSAMSAEQQLLFQVKQKKGSDSLAALEGIMGILKDDISDEQLEEMLRDTHR